MVTPEIINYIKEQLAKGATRDQISDGLRRGGVTETDIDGAWKSLSSPAVSSAPTPPPISTPPVTVVMPTTSRPVTTPTSHKWIWIVGLILLVAVAVVGFFLFKNWTVSETTVEPEAEVSVEDLRIAYVPVPEEENSLSIFNSIGTSTIATKDKEFLKKYYFLTYPATNTPPLAESRAILKKYKNVLTAFEAGVNKKYYQCSFAENTCSLQVLRDVSNLAAINVFVLQKDGKTEEAKQYAEKITTLGKMLTAESNELITSLVGWVIQKLGYTILGGIEQKAVVSTDTKTSLIQTLRDEHKKVMRFEYNMQLEAVDYITDPNKKPSGLVDQGTEDTFNEYRKVANSITWKPDIVKKWFYDSTKISLSNIDLSCGSKLQESKIDISFDSKDTTNQENYAGKALYSIMYASLDSTNLKRCDVERAIEAL